MTFVTGTQTEVLYVMPAAGAALATSTTKTLISGNAATNPPYQMPSLLSLWGPSYAQGRALRIVARGTWGDTTTAPTLTISLQLDPTQNSSTSAITLAATGALTVPGTSVTNGAWELEVGIDINSVGISAGAYTSNIDCVGKFVLGAGNNASTVAAVAYMVGSAAAITTVVPTTAYFVELWATWGTSNAANTIQCQQFEILGLN